MLAKILDLKTLSWQRRSLHCQKMEGKNGLQMLYLKKKEERLGKHELKLYFTFTQKWSSTKYMLIFCNKWKLLHEKRVQSRQYIYFFLGGGGGGISTWLESCFVVVVSVFVLFSMSPPSWSIAEISSGKVSTLDLKHTDDTDASVQRTSIAKLHNP